MGRVNSKINDYYGGKYKRRRETHPLARPPPSPPLPAPF